MPLPQDDLEGAEDNILQIHPNKNLTVRDCQEMETVPQVPPPPGRARQVTHVHPLCTSNRHSRVPQPGNNRGHSSPALSLLKFTLQQALFKLTHAMHFKEHFCADPFLDLGSEHDGTASQCGPALPEPESEGCQDVPVHVHGRCSMTQCLVKCSFADDNASCKERALLMRNLVQKYVLGRAHCFNNAGNLSVCVRGSAPSCPLHHRHKARLENEGLPYAHWRIPVHLIADSWHSSPFRGHSPAPTCSQFFSHRALKTTWTTSLRPKHSR
uniref:Uncharacterized protein n=1 Tax=Rousettus aegyptiacus TaxID=9407 RepID=A0A7J8DHG9_ROUAE|nr:hypothetical protein HJG63_008491 [Rousettus aegyptiacus]